MATFGFGPCEAMHTFNLPCKNPSDYFKRWRPSDLGPARRCTRSWWPAFNVSPHAVESSEQKFHPISKQNNLGINYRLSLECERLSEIMNKTSLIPKMSISYPQCSVIDMTQDGTRQNIPPPSLHRRPADLIRKVCRHLYLQVLSGLKDTGVILTSIEIGVKRLKQLTSIYQKLQLPEGDWRQGCARPLSRMQG